MANPLDTWKQHAEFTQAAKGLTGKDVIPEYGMQTGYDFQKKYNLNPKVSSVLASGWQLGQEGVRGLGKYLTGDPGALKDAWGTAKKQSAQNIEGILAAHAGTLTPEQQQIRNEYLEGVGQKPDAPFIDPTGRNLFTQYYEDDPYAGIKGQTAMATFGPGAHLLDYDDLRTRIGPPLTKFKQQQIMNRRKQQMQEMIRQAEAAEAAKQKAAADAAEQNRQQAQVTAQANREAEERVSRGEAKDWGKTETRESSGWESSPFEKGGLVNFFKYGGFLG